MANQFLSLSLFIMLLSFFIILNSMSNFESSKAREALKSLTTTFQIQELVQGPDSGYQPVEKFVKGRGSALDQLEGLFNAQIAGVDIQKNRLGTQMHVQMPVREFEENIRGQGGSGGKFSAMLSSLLVAQEHIAYRMDMVLNVEENPAFMAGENPEKTNQYLKRISVLAQDVKDIGIPEKLITAGLGSGDKDTLDIFFRPQEGKRADNKEEAQ